MGGCGHCRYPQGERRLRRGQGFFGSACGGVGTPPLQLKRGAEGAAPTAEWAAAAKSLRVYAKITPKPLQKGSFPMDTTVKLKLGFAALMIASGHRRGHVPRHQQCGGAASRKLGH